MGVEIKELEPNQQLALKEAVRDGLDRNPFLRKSIEELEKFKGESKDLSVSQNHNMMQMKNFRKELQEKNISHSAETKEQLNQKAEQALSLSTRFNKTLTYNQGPGKQKRYDTKRNHKSTKRARKRRALIPIYAFIFISRW